jgi:hypothetical protein
MKLESLKSSKFDAFKENEISKSVKILGGQDEVEITGAGTQCRYRNGEYIGCWYYSSDVVDNSDPRVQFTSYTWQYEVDQEC